MLFITTITKKIQCPTSLSHAIQKSEPEKSNFSTPSTTSFSRRTQPSSPAYPSLIIFLRPPLHDNARRIFPTVATQPETSLPTMLRGGGLDPTFCFLSSPCPASSSGVDTCMHTCMHF
ncbi:hypothetical protein CEXT_557721 [Caerostris extrusa]|uniref:Uncharacterized protein n=1 Tax=Caerostris extrusa TaxID=172846 RepID=A0AAV4W8B0_CAEEX|nr:hypothetical protein CEXT_557721 [Caerostris extrusa]